MESKETKLTRFDCTTCGHVNGSKECETCVSNANDAAAIPSNWFSKMEAVNHPSHYQSKSGLEAIDVIEAFCDGLNGIEAFCTGNALKYLCRWKSKNGIEDLKKAEWYINRLIEHIETSDDIKEPSIVCTPDDIIVNGVSMKEKCKELEIEKENK